MPKPKKAVFMRYSCSSLLLNANLEASQLVLLPFLELHFFGDCLNSGAPNLDCVYHAFSGGGHGV
jgi:hypothetical protein